MVRIILLLFILIRFNSFSQTKEEQILYFSVGYGISSLAILTCEKYEIKRPFLIGFSAGVIAGVGKELYDNYFIKGNLNGLSLMSTTLGSALGCVTLKIPINKN